ncbi:putative kinase C-like, phorbol ester/diacylglycerol-binding protein [Helianthus debilis subsp. tardiflorus]
MSQCSHNHNFLLKSVKHPYFCQRCGQLGFRMSYSCEKSECNLFSHKECEKPKSLVQHPFSTKCVFKFYTNISGKGCLCHVCGKSIQGYHYGCSCNFVKRYAHSSCLAYQPTFEAFDGLTMNLQKVAPAKCLHCMNENLSSKVDGWAYVSPCGLYCYHVSCVMDIINENWKKAFMNGTSDPFQTIRERFPAHVNRRKKMAKGKRKVRDPKKVATAQKLATAFSVIFNVLTGNPQGLVSDAEKFFG